MERFVGFWVDNKVLVGLLVVFLVVWGLLVAPFDWELAELPRSPVPVDAIPDIGENQQIVFTEWPGRSPQDVEDQITYPLTVSLLGVPAVKTIRSVSYFGFSSIFVLFDEEAEFYWSRSRILEKLSSLPIGTLPDGVRPALGPDATPLGQIFWYTLEGRDATGTPAGGWDLNELRSIQDWYVRYRLMAVEGVAEVASIGGFVQEYQIDVDPDAMRAHGVSLPDVFRAVQASNVDVGARTIEINRVEHVIRGLGFLRGIEDIEKAVISARSGVPITVGNVATVSLGPALRRGALDREGAEAVGGVVVARYGENPLAVINRLKDEIEEITTGLPSKRLADGRVSKLEIVDFYDRSELIHETLGTLERALIEEILVTIVVVIVLLMHLRSAVLVSGMLPLTVLVSFAAMKVFEVDANVVALSGIAIAIGTIVDVGIVVTENVLARLHEAPATARSRDVVVRATAEVGSAVLTAVLTTVVSFLPVFTMEAAEGKLFRPLAFTKTFALLASIFIALVILPALAHLILASRPRPAGDRVRAAAFALGGGALLVNGYAMAGALCLLFAARAAVRERISSRWRGWLDVAINLAVGLAVTSLLAEHWAPLGPDKGIRNLVFAVLLIGTLLALVVVLQRSYRGMLGWCLDNKAVVLLVALVIVAGGATVWLGFGRVFAVVPATWGAVGGDPLTVRSARLWRRGAQAFPGLGKEFMPPLDEGSFLFMPTTMPHASIGEAMDVLRKQDMAIASIPEVESVLGKLGRAESPLDPAPVSMFETIVHYVSEYTVDADGRSIRQWRDSIRSPDDIWDEIVRVTRIPGTTLAPRLQPIAARLVMLQSGMRAPMGVKVFGPDQSVIDRATLDIERQLKRVPGVQAAAVVADRMISKPYVEIDIDRDAIARHGITIRDIQTHIEVAIGGRAVTTTIEGRERYPVRVRYLREYRDQIEQFGKILVVAPGGSQIPLAQLAHIRSVTGPQAIKSEDTFLVGYVLFDKLEGQAEVDVVERAQRFLASARESGELVLPAGVSYRFSGTYENQVRSEKRLALVLPLALFLIFVILYLHFRSVATTLVIFSSVLLAWAGGFWLLWLYGQGWFLDFTLFDANMRDLFSVHPRNLSVAVWVGFLALFGLATDDGVILATYIGQRFREVSPQDRAHVRQATIDAAARRIRPCLMTSATTVLALIPVLTSTGRGADVMVPMAIPSFGGMLLVTVSIFVVPTLHCAIAERRLARPAGAHEGGPPDHSKL